MLDRFVRSMANSFYLVPGQVKKFKEQHPDTQVLVADATKARKVKSNAEGQYELGWATARRNVLILTTNGLFCGDWTIPLSNIQEATLIHISGGSLLKVSTTDGLNYQFGLQRNPEWEAQKILPLNIQQGALKFSKTGLILRLLLLAWLAYIVSQDYLRNGFSLASLIYLLLLIWIVLPFVRLLKFPKPH
jgi:hypothetical protein